MRKPTPPKINMEPPKNGWFLGRRKPMFNSVLPRNICSSSTAVNRCFSVLPPRPSHPLTRIGARHGARLSCCTKSQGPNDAHRRTKSFTQILPCIGQADIFLGHFCKTPRGWENKMSPENGGYADLVSLKK